MSVEDWRFDLAGTGFGRGTGYKVTGWDTGVPEWRTQDGEVPGGDGRVFGRDFLSGRQWAFDLTINVPSRQHADALELLAPLAAAWAQPDVRTTPGVVVPLRYGLAGRTRRVYGRPRRFSPLWQHLSIGRIPVVADFACADHLHYDDEESSLTVDLVADSGRGFAAPFTAPIVLDPPVQRQGFFTVGGDAATWPVVTFFGPASGSASGLWAAAAGWRVELAKPVAAGEVVVVDSRPWARSVTRNGSGAPGWLAPSTRITAMAVPPGDHELTFGGVDPSATAQCRLAWRAAWQSL